MGPGRLRARRSQAARRAEVGRQRAVASRGSFYSRLSVTRAAVEWAGGALTHGGEVTWHILLGGQLFDFCWDIKFRSVPGGHQSQRFLSTRFKVRRRRAGQGAGVGTGRAARELAAPAALFSCQLQTDLKTRPSHLRREPRLGAQTGDETRGHAVRVSLLTLCVAIVSLAACVHSRHSGGRSVSRSACCPRASLEPSFLQNFRGLRREGRPRPRHTPRAQPWAQYFPEGSRGPTSRFCHWILMVFTCGR